MNLLAKIRMDTTERLLYLAFGLTILVTGALIAGLLILRSQNAGQTALINDAIGKLNSQATTIENLAKDNKALNQQQINYTYCNAVIIARWTQTQQPIQIKDLNKCVLENQKNVNQALNQIMLQSESRAPANNSSGGNTVPAQSSAGSVPQQPNGVTVTPAPGTTPPLLVVPPLPTPCLMLGAVSLC